MKNTSKATALIFILFITVFFALFFVSPKHEFSEMENRTLAQMPKFTSERLFDDSFTSEFEEYVTDQFPLRDTWVGMKYFFERALLKTENNGVYFAKDGYLISKFKEPDSTRLSANFDAVQRLYDSLDVPVSFSLVPTSAYVYADKLPKNAVPYDQQTILDMAEALDAYFDLSETLVNNKNEYIYYRTDHHWTSDGAYCAYKDICKALGTEPIERIHRKDYFPFYGTLYSNAGARAVRGDTVSTYELPDVTVTDENGEAMELYDESFGSKKDKYSVFFGGNRPLITVQNNEMPEGEKLLIIKDSYSNCLVPYLCYNFSQIHMWDLRFNKTDLKEYVQNNGIDRVLVLYSTENFSSDVNISLMCR